MRLKNGAYWLVRTGKKWFRLGDADKQADALAAYAVQMGTPVGGGDGEPVTTLPASSVESMGALLERAYPHICQRARKHTIETWNAKHARLVHAFRDVSLAQFNATHMHKLRYKFEKKPSIFNGCLTVMRLCLKWASASEGINLASIETVKLLPAPHRTRYMRNDEYDAIYSNGNELVQILLELCYRTGQRIGDILNIQHWQLQDEGIIFTQGKTSKKLTVGWSPELRSACERAKKLSAEGQVVGIGTRNAPRYLLATRGGFRFQYETFHHFFHKAAKAGDVPNVRIHDLRAKAATDIAREYGIEAARLLMGHSTQAMTERYIRDRCAVVVAGPSAMAVGPSGGRGMSTPQGGPVGSNPRANKPNRVKVASVRRVSAA
jgi:integrase